MAAVPEAKRAVIARMPAAASGSSSISGCEEEEESEEEEGFFFAAAVPIFISVAEGLLAPTRVQA